MFTFLAHHANMAERLCEGVSGFSEDMLHTNISPCFARMCRGSLSDGDVDRCARGERGQDNTQAAYTAPRVNMWVNPIKRRPQL